MDKDHLWIVQHFSELVEEHAGKYIAVVNEKLVAVSHEFSQLELSKTR